jgi:nucleoside-diphosphate-sugar epimerase
VRIALTGGRGRLGRYVAAELRQRSHEVRIIDRAAPDAGEPSLYSPVDVLDYGALAVAFRDQEVVVHLAGIDQSLASAPAAVFETNVRGTWNAFEAAERAGARRMVLCSSTSALGLDHTNPTLPPIYLPVDEAHPTRPSSTYGMSKLLGEEIAAAFARRGALEVLVLRPSYVAFPEMLGFLSGAKGTQVEREAEPVPLLRSYVSPEDAARAFALAVEHTYARIETFLLAAGDTFTDVPTLDHLRRTYGALPPIRRPQVYKHNPRASVLDNSRARRALGWEPTTSWPQLRQQD